MGITGEGSAVAKDSAERIHTLALDGLGRGASSEIQAGKLPQGQGQKTEAVGKQAGRAGGQTERVPNQTRKELRAMATFKLTAVPIPPQADSAAKIITQSELADLIVLRDVLAETNMCNRERAGHSRTSSRQLDHTAGRRYGGREEELSRPAGVEGSCERPRLQRETIIGVATYRRNSTRAKWPGRGGAHR
jgi:hypothetical protein